MPTYDYICRACDHEFELFQSMKDSAKKKCPKCGKSSLERLIGTGAAVVFKGSGFYQTDYRSESYKKAQAADTEKAKPAESKPETKAESKADGKGEAKSEATPGAKSEAKPAAKESKPTKESSAKESPAKSASKPRKHS